MLQIQRSCSPYMSGNRHHWLCAGRVAVQESEGWRWWGDPINAVDRHTYAINNSRTAQAGPVCCLLFREWQPPRAPRTLAATWAAAVAVRAKGEPSAAPIYYLRVASWICGGSCNTGHCARAPRSIAAAAASPALAAPVTCTGGSQRLDERSAPAAAAALPPPSPPPCRRRRRHAWPQAPRLLPSAAPVARLRNGGASR